MTDRRHKTVVPLVLAACVLLPAAMLRAEGPPIGTPEGFVNDRANILTAAQRQALEAKLRGFADGEPFVQIAVLTIPSLGGETVEDYAQRVFDAWKFGEKGKDNGALLLVAVEDRTLRIHTGYGVEGKLTDATCGQIIRNEITPTFKRKDYNGGINAGVDAMAGIVSGEFDAESRWKNTGSGSDPGRFMFLGVMIAVIGGGLAGGLWKKNKVAAIVCLLVAIGVVWLLIFPCFAAFASVFAILSFVKGFGRATGRTGWFFAGGSGFGGGGGGGFGGFGGGSSGGGGASGGW